MSEAPRDQLIEDAEALREKGDAKAALAILLEIGTRDTDDAEVALLIARAYDSIGQERDAVPWFERALAHGLVDEDHAEAAIGLGSDLRSLGEFERAIEVLALAHSRYPTNRAIETFLAMARFNAGDQQVAFETLLRILAENSGDQDIRAHAGALTFFAEDIAATWG